VYGDERIEPMYVMLFTSGEERDVAKRFADIARERGFEYDERELLDILYHNTAMYIRELKLFIQRVKRWEKLMYVNTHVFFHEVTHHVVYSTGMLQKLAEKIFDYIPTLIEIEDLLEEVEMEYYMTWVDELFAHYVTACYLDLLGKEPCDITKFRTPSLDSIEKEFCGCVYDVHEDAELAEELGRDLRNARISPEVKRILHETFISISDNFPADVYRKYLRKGFNIMSGMEEVIRKFSLKHLLSSK